MTLQPRLSPIRWAAITSIGLRRDSNEDSVVVGDLVFTGDMTDPVTGSHTDDTPIVLAVADGLGGHAAGERASRLVADGLARHGVDLTGGDAIAHVLGDLNARLYATTRMDRTTVGMGTTVAGVVIAPDRITVFHVGDSRAYVARHDARFDQVTEDHVLVQGSGILTQCIGGEDRLTPIDVSLTVVDREDVTAVAVCTDGLRPRRPWRPNRGSRHRPIRGSDSATRPGFSRWRPRQRVRRAHTPRQVDGP